MVPLLALYTLFNAGVAMIAARLTVHVRDLTQVLPFISRILFYTSGVLFDVNKIFAEHPWVIRLYDFYPIYQVLADGPWRPDDEPSVQPQLLDASSRSSRWSPSVSAWSSSGWPRRGTDVTEPARPDRQPVVVVDDLHVMYRVYAGGRAAAGNAAASGLLKRTRGIRTVHA